LILANAVASLMPPGHLSHATELYRSAHCLPKQANLTCPRFLVQISLSGRELGEFLAFTANLVNFARLEF